MNINQFAKFKYLEYSKYDGSQHIASEYALGAILKIIKIFNLKNILEVGLGIGSISNSIIEYFDKNLNYVGTESNIFCLESLKRNFDADIYKKISIINSIENLNINYKFDLVIIDGENEKFQVLKKYLIKNAIIVIEGDRMSQVEQINNAFPNARFVHLISIRKNNISGVFNAQYWQGGLKVFFINPTFNQYVFWGIEKIKMKIKYLLRKIIDKK